MRDGAPCERTRKGSSMAALEMLDVEAEASTPPALGLVRPRAAQIADRPTEDFGDTLHGLCAQLAGTTTEARGISLACTVDHQQIPGAIAADLRSIALGLIASAYNSFAGGRGGRIGVRFHVAATGLELHGRAQAARDQANEFVMMEGRLVRQLGGRITVPRVIGGICIVVMLPRR